MKDNENTDNLMKTAESLLEQLFDKIPEDQLLTEDDMSFEDFLDEVFGKENYEENE